MAIFPQIGLCAAVALVALPAKSAGEAQLAQVRLSAVEVKSLGIQSAPAAVGSLAEPLSCVGTVAFDDLSRVRVYAPVSGKVLQVAARLGQHVNKDAPLAVLQSADMAAVRADVDRAKATLLAATQAVARQKKLFVQKASSARALEEAHDNFRRAQAERARAEQQMALLGGARGVADNSNFVLRAPLAGEVVSSSIDLGRQVQGQYAGGAPEELFTIANLDRVWLLADVHEADIGLVRRGASVRVRPAALGSAPDAQMGSEVALPLGRVDWIADVVDPQAHTLQVRCICDNTKRNLRPNMKVLLQIDAEAQRELRVAADSVVRIDKQAYVFIDAGASADGGSVFVLRPIEVVDMADGEDTSRIAVTHGLVVGERVVTQGSARLLQSLAQQVVP